MPVSMAGSDGKKLSPMVPPETRRRAPATASVVDSQWIRPHYCGPKRLTAPRGLGLGPDLRAAPHVPRPGRTSLSLSVHENHDFGLVFVVGVDEKLGLEAPRRGGCEGDVDGSDLAGGHLEGGLGQLE